MSPASATSFLQQQLNNDWTSAILLLTDELTNQLTQLKSTDWPLKSRHSKNQSYFTTEVYGKSVPLGVKPLETHDQIFLTEPLRL
jgi:hypothetical protein